MMIIRILVSMVVMLGLDGLWIGVIARSSYYTAYGHILNLHHGQLQPVWWAAALVYVLLLFGVHYYGFCMLKISWKQVVIQAAIFGWVVYGVYDFTCLALFKSWPIIMTCIDVVWGGVLCGLTAFLTLLFCRLI
ncbi:MAG: DUF2177 family protein [Gammaproteobacteria bacterium]|nr:DUF2177 family protein [Gammaproteobacteria bacterium]